MPEGIETMRINKVAREFNIGISTIVEFLAKKGHKIENSPNAKITADQYNILVAEFHSEKTVKEESKRIAKEFAKHETVSIEDASKDDDFADEKDDEIFIKQTSGFVLDLLKPKAEPKPEPKPEPKVVQPPAPAPAPEPKPEPPKATIPEPPKREAEPIVELQVQKPVNEEKVEIEKPVQKVDLDEDNTGEVEITGEQQDDDQQIKVLGRIDLDSMNTRTRPKRKSKEEKDKERNERFGKPKTQHPDDVEVKSKEAQEEKHEIVLRSGQASTQSEPTEVVHDENFIKTKYEKLEGPKVLGRMELPVNKPIEKKIKPVASSTDEQGASKKKKRKRIKKTITPVSQTEVKQHEKPKLKQSDKLKKKNQPKPELTAEEIQKQIKETLSKLTSPNKSKTSKYRRQKRDAVQQHHQEELEKQEQEKKVIKVTEFVTANELANMMNAQVTQIIATCMSLGLFVSINQRLDAETIVIVAEEFGFSVEFVSVEVQEAITEEEIDDPSQLMPRAPIVTVMGHVDHGKTSLLDYIRKTNVIAGEAGGITQHIGAYEVQLEDGRKITFLDTPGHEAFTAMRARGAKVTDVAIIVVAADDNVMPQTKEAINHAKAAEVPLVFAINKIDKPGANPEKIKEELAGLNILVEDWGGKYQSQEISAKKGVNIEALLEKVLLEAELLELKSNPNRLAYGTILESSLDKGRGYVAKVLVQNGTLKIGDMVLAGYVYGKVKAMYNERNQAVKEAGPATPVLLLGLNGAPQAGDSFNVMKDERETKSIANKRLQLQREQGLRTQKHITLDEIGRRIAIGDFKELNIIVKGDVDGSVEALSDSLLKLSNREVQVNIIHKSVGQISETDVMLASASDAVIVGFQVRPSMQARKLAEQEQIDIRLYSIIYQAIEEIKSAIEGMLAPTLEEKIICNIEVRDTFKITKVGTVAGCYVLDGKVTRNTKVRIIRDGIVVYTGYLGSLKRFKDDVKEVLKGYECGLNIDNFNDIKVGDIIEGFEQIEVKRTL